MSNEEAKNEARRRVLGAGVMSAAAMALAGMSTPDAGAQPEGSAPRSSAPAAKLIERDVTFQSGDAKIAAFWAEPVVRPKAAIIIIHEIFGLNAHIRDLARRFARQGYVTLAPDLYSREGTPNVDTSDMDALRKMVAAIPDGRMVGDLQAAVEYLNAEGLPRVGSIGFCMGGLYSYLLACKSDKLNAAVDFYGRIVYAETNANKPESPLDLAPQLKCPLLCNFGEKDASIPVADIEKLRDKLKESTQPWTINIYPGAGHAFFNDTRPSYQAQAAADAGNHTLSFLKKYLQTETV